MRLFAAILAVLLLGASPAPSPLAISIQNGQLAGPGARVLGDAAAGAHFVLLGEDHGTSEIAAFADAFFTSLVPLGYRTIAVETGPILTERLRTWIAAPDGRVQYAAFEKNHGGTTAFYGWQREFAFLEHANRATGGALRLWGLDQELMGSSKYLLESMLEQHPGARSTALIRQMLHEDESRLPQRRAFRRSDGDVRSASQAGRTCRRSQRRFKKTATRARTHWLAPSLRPATSMSIAATSWQLARIAIGRCL